MGLAVVLVLASVGSVEQSATSDNFLVRSPGKGPVAGEVAALCEQARREIHAHWFGEPAPTAWRPLCEVVVHRETNSYLAAVGWGGLQTRGSSSVRFQRHEIVGCRIDLLLDAHGQLPDCLCHEVTHIVLANWCCRDAETRSKKTIAGQQMPRWADEGMASFADAASKQARYRQDVYRAAHEQRLLPLVRVLTADRYPGNGERASFYGQSLILVDYLLEQGPPQKLVTFVESAQQHGYDAALRGVYQINGIAELEQLWRGYVQSRLRADGTIAETLASDSLHERSPALTRLLAPSSSRSKRMM